MFRKSFLILAASAAIFALSLSAFSQSKKSSVKTNNRFAEMIKAARDGKSMANPEIIEKVKAAYAEEKAENFSAFGSIVGTWNVTVQGDGGFYALQTFNVDGTYTETSSLLSTLTEGPSHGVWEYRRRGLVLTFEVFEFDPGTGEPIGRIRVRNFIQMTGGDSFSSEFAADFIEPDGTVIENIGSGSFTGERMQIRGL